MRVWVTLLLFAGGACAQPGIHGTVRDIAGLPAAGVLVTATREGVALTSSRVTEEGGGFTFSNLSAGAYTVGTDRDPAIKHIRRRSRRGLLRQRRIYAGWVRQGDDIQQRRLAGGILRLAPGASGALRIVLARDTAELAVAVRDPDGKPVPNVTVILVPDAVTSVSALSRLHNIGHTDQYGNLTVRDLAPGKHRVLATPQTVHWEVPEDLQRVLLMIYQAKEVGLEPKASAQIAVAPVAIF